MLEHVCHGPSCARVRAPPEQIEQMRDDLDASSSTAGGRKEALDALSEQACLP